jgi:hypothetical protein
MMIISYRIKGDNVTMVPYLTITRGTVRRRVWRRVVSILSGLGAKPAFRTPDGNVLIQVDLDHPLLNEVLAEERIGELWYPVTPKGVRHQLEHLLRRHVEVVHDEAVLIMDHLFKARGDPWRIQEELLADLVEGGFKATHVEQSHDSTESLLSEIKVLYTTIAQAVMVARSSNDSVLLLARMMPLPPLLWVVTTTPLEMPHRIPAISWISHPSDLTTVLDALVGIKEVRVSWEP